MCDALACYTEKFDALLGMRIQREKCMRMGNHISGGNYTHHMEAWKRLHRVHGATTRPHGEQTAHIYCHEIGHNFTHSSRPGQPGNREPPRSGGRERCAFVCVVNDSTLYTSDERARRIPCFGPTRLPPNLPPNTKANLINLNKSRCVCVCWRLGSVDHTV